MIYALTFLVFEKIFSTALGQRVRGLVTFTGMVSPTSYIDSDFPLLKAVFFIFNITFFYKLMKKINRIKFLVSITRLQSRLTGYICKLPVLSCFRRPLFGLFSAIYGVKIEEAQRDRFD